MFVRANFVDTHLQGMHDRSMRSGTELAREIQLTDWSTAGNLSNRSSGVQIPRDICTRLKRLVCSAVKVCLMCSDHLFFRILACSTAGLFGNEGEQSIPYSSRSF